MKNFIRKNLYFAAFFWLIVVSKPSFAGLDYQNFEPNNGSDTYGWAGGFGVQAGLVSMFEAQWSTGVQSWKVNAPNTFWNTTGIQSQVETWNTNFHPESNDRITFWTRAIPDAGWWVFGPIVTHNNVSVRLFDHGNYAQSGYEAWTTEKATYQEWTQLEVLFSQFPPDFDFNHVDKIELKNYWRGVYYFDDIKVISADRIYQSFDDQYAEEFGWKWNDGDFVGLSTANEPVYSGSHSWKMVTNGYWGGGGIKSQEQKYTSPGQQSYWNVDLNPALNDRLTLWVYALPSNGLDNNLNVQFYDNGVHNTDNTKVEIWTKTKAVYGEWTKITILFNQLPSDLNLNDLNKIQIQFYWPGTYYIDDIRATRAAPVIDKTALNDGIVKWNTVPNAATYILDDSTVSSSDGWASVTQTTQTSVPVTHIIPTWYRVRWQEAVPINPTLSYTSDYSEFVLYQPKKVFIYQDKLETGIIDWPQLAAATEYQVEESPSENGPWHLIYDGPYPNNPLPANNTQWHRIRAVKRVNSLIEESTPWSAPQAINNLKKFVKANSTQIQKEGSNRSLILQGVNLGNIFLIEPEFAGIGGNFTPNNLFDDDDQSIRNELINRFGSDELLEEFQNAYITEVDLDRLAQMGVNFVRLPIYYQVIADDNGNWTQFDQIDRIIKYCADRGMYVLLDLHGAPGGQNKEIHSGQKNLNRLFENSLDGQNYRTQTINLWKAIAQRYKNNRTVVAYDILNEPFGALDHDPTFVKPNGLWTLYNQLYTAIRTIDPNHLIIMESIPSLFDWDTLPKPTNYNWTNVMYQFHYYGFKFDDEGHIIGTLEPEEHRTYIDEKIFNSKQAEYNVPVLIGEFNSFNQRTNWEYDLSKFIAQGWSWSMWTYKSHPNLGDWGLYLHDNYDETTPNVTNDSLTDLTRKFSKFVTLGYFSPNVTLIKILTQYLNVIRPEDAPIINEVLPESIPTGGNITINGQFFGEQGSLSQVLLNQTPLNILTWSNTQITAAIPNQEWPTQTSLVVKTAGGISNPFTIKINQPPTITKLYLTDGLEEMVIVGDHFTSTPAQVWFWPNNCQVNDPSTCPKGYAQIIYWSNNVIRCKIPINALNNGSVRVITPSGVDIEPWNKSLPVESGPFIVGKIPTVNKSWLTIGYTGPINTPAVATAHMQSFNNADTAAVRIRNVKPTQMTIKIEEEKSKDSETTHPNEQVGFAVLGKGFILNNTGEIIGETGVVNRQQIRPADFYTINLKRTYTNPIVIMTINTTNGSEPAHVRLNQIKQNSFQYQIEEWDYLDEKHSQETLSYIVIEQGAHQAFGKKILAEKITVNHNWATISLGNQSFTAVPVVFSQPQTFNSSEAIVTRQRQISKSSFAVRLQEEERNNNIHVNESVGYLAIQ